MQPSMAKRGEDTEADFIDMSKTLKMEDYPGVEVCLKCNYMSLYKAEGTLTQTEGRAM